MATKNSLSPYPLQLPFRDFKKLSDPPPQETNFTDITIKIAIYWSIPINPNKFLDQMVTVTIRVNTTFDLVLASSKYLNKRTSDGK